MQSLPRDHTFTHPELDYEAKPNFQSAIKVSVLFRKFDGISHEEFFTHWQTVHADLAVAKTLYRTTFSDMFRYESVLDGHDQPLRAVAY